MGFNVYRDDAASCEQCHCGRSSTACLEIYKIIGHSMKCCCCASCVNEDTWKWMDGRSLTLQYEREPHSTLIKCKYTYACKDIGFSIGYTKQTIQSFITEFIYLPFFSYFIIFFSLVARRDIYLHDGTDDFILFLQHFCSLSPGGWWWWWWWLWGWCGRRSGGHFALSHRPRTALALINKMSMNKHICVILVDIDSTYYQILYWLWYIGIG